MVDIGLSARQMGSAGADGGGLLRRGKLDGCGAGRAQQCRRQQAADHGDTGSAEERGGESVGQGSLSPSWSARYEAATAVIAARPSAEPTWYEVLTIPDARPPSSGRADEIAVPNDGPAGQLHPDLASDPGDDQRRHRHQRPPTRQRHGPGGRHPADRPRVARYRAGDVPYSWVNARRRASAEPKPHRRATPATGS